MSALKRHTASSLIRSFISGVRAVVPVMLKQDPGARGVRGSLLTIASNAAHHGAPEKAVSERMFMQNLPGADRKLQIFPAVLRLERSFGIAEQVPCCRRFRLALLPLTQLNCPS